MKKLPVSFLIILVATLFFHMNAYSKTVYSIHDLCTIADKTAETILNSKEDLFKAEQDKQRALSVLIPRATAFGAATRYDDTDAYSVDSTSGGVKLTQSFTLNGKELIAYDVTKRTIEERDFALESVRADYFLQISQSYFGILSTERLLEIADAEVKRLTTHRDGVKEKLDVGNVTKTALHRAEAELSKARTDRVIAYNRYRQSKAALFNLVEIEEDFDISKEDIEGISDFNLTREEITARALENRNEVKSAKKSLEIATRTIDFEKGAYWPSVSLEGGYKETEIENDTSSGTTFTNDMEDLYVTAELSFTLFDGGLRKADVRKAKSDARKAKNGLDLVEKKLILDSKNAFYEYETAKNALINLADEVESAQENYKAVNMQFEHGMADSIDIMDANTLLATAERRIAEAKYTLDLSILTLIYTQGNIVPFLSNK